ncbi:MAG: dihydroorotate dehydrogenase electron transfer subunit [Deltaproteobacteria bacterium]|nr:dihydroorotate dehydrogenase electron transfer subunit [Deltaproteobacteria bacterium]
MTKYNQLKVVHVRHYKANYVSLTLSYDNQMEIPMPGQFFMLKPHNTLLGRPISVHNFFRILKKGYIEFLFKIVGKGTKNLSELKRGDYVSLWGPIGNSFPTFENKKTAILVAGGRGIAPLFFLATKLFEKRYEIHFFYGVKKSEELIHILRLRNMSNKLFISTEDGKRGKKGLITDLFKSAINTYTSSLKDNLLFHDQGNNAVCYVCGPDIMMEKVCEVSLSHKIKTYISLESHIACGSGVCLGCTVESTGGQLFHVCKEGPVFDAEEIYCK